jgi:hypothetical protein
MEPNQEEKRKVQKKMNLGEIKLIFKNFRKECNFDGCTAKLSSNNTSGYCAFCQKKTEIRKSRTHIFFNCRVCNSQIENTSGFCWKCVKSSDEVRIRYERFMRSDDEYKNPGCCLGCCKPFRKTSKTGYCGECFHQNIDGIKTKYSKDNKTSRYIKNWLRKGLLISPEEMFSHLNSTNCQICENLFSEDSSSFRSRVLDHCHLTNKFRGSICKQCNLIVGQLGDDVKTIVKQLNKYIQ